MLDDNVVDATVVCIFVVVIQGNVVVVVVVVVAVLILPDELRERCRCSTRCSNSCSRPTNNADVALCLYAADAGVEDDVYKALLIDVVEDVDHEFEDAHDVLMCLFFPPLSFMVTML